MSGENRQMKLGAFFMIPGHHVAAWRHPEAETDGVMSFDFYKRLANTAERGKFDMIFVADGLTIGWGRGQALISHAVSTRPEPLTLLSALSAVTERIGLVATLSSTYDEPFHVARRFASLDHLSGGRAGWNVVTTGSEEAAFNFSKDEHLLHELRYERAREFLQVVKGLWDSWEDDALILDKESAVFADPDRVHTLNHKGRWFSVRGPLNISRAPQGHPVVIQAGSSEDGKEFAAQTAEVIFTAWQTLAEAQSFYSDVKGRLTTYDRSPEDLKIMPGIFPIIGRTRAEADEKQALLADLIPPPVGVGLLSGLIGFDLSGYPLDGPLPELPSVAAINGGKSRHTLVKDLAERDSLTIRQLYKQIAGARGHREIKGTPEDIADQMEDWFINDAADGFNIMPPYLPAGLDDFVDLVIPELQRRGLFRTEYTGHTLREHLGLPRPVSQFARRATVVS